MAAASEDLSDWTILTSDNPRREDPETILADVKAGMRGTKFEMIADREQAIRHAIGLAAPGDIVLVAGKGHESYQEFADRRIAFDDVAVAGKAMADRKAEG